eukprot:6897681-Ditylum_brightwellii.AAC.1
MDEECAISKSADFTSMMIDEFPGNKTNITGGYASWINGKIEKPHETIKNRTQATLMDTGKEEIYWCYASTDGIT